jgi:hypothetical protein
MTGCVKLRNGFLMLQISKDDPRRQVLATIPKIVLWPINKWEGSDVKSTVKVTRQHGSSHFRFEIRVLILNPSKIVRRAIEPLKIPRKLDKNGVYVDTRKTICDVYQEVGLTFFKADDNPTLLEYFLKCNGTKFVIKCDGTIIDVYNYY